MALPCPRNFTWFVADKLAGMGYPQPEGIPFLAAEGIKTLINVTRGTPNYSEAAAAHRITMHSIDVQDFCPPTTEQIEEFIRLVDNADGGVGVHCAMGRGRTGTMLACYLVAKEGYSGDAAIEETRRRRRGSIETRLQEQAVRDFEDHLRLQKSSP